MNVTSFRPFGEKQLAALTWWCPSSPYADRDAVICDGAVRWGKTVGMTLSFIAWAFARFDSTAFALCGKTIASLRRNVTAPLLPTLRELGFECTEKISQNKLAIRFEGRMNTFFLFGGKDEASASLIQGMTLGGVLFDEVALMPRSFVEQALARCSLEGAKFWFNCNPDNPLHWFHTEWIKRAEERNCLYLHFTMQDNPSLSPKTIARYKALYSGVFYRRFILGEWTAPRGLIYPFFSAEHDLCDPPPRCEEYRMSCDYGTVNPTSIGLWGKKDGVWYRVAEYYQDSRATGEQRTDEEHYRALEKLAGDKRITAITVDPSAASFIECIRRHGRFTVIPANNDVLDGIRKTSQALKDGRIKICRGCEDAVRELGLYCWETDRAKDTPKKENDHAMDDMRYFVATLMDDGSDGFWFGGVERGSLMHN